MAVDEAAGRFALVVETRSTHHDAVFAAGLVLGLALVILVDRLV